MIKQKAFNIQKNVIVALFLREIKSRFTKNKMGIFWIFLEPLIHIIILATIFYFLTKHIIPNVSYPMFLMTGILPWLFFKNSLSKSINAIESNLGLFTYKQVKAIDTIISRTLIEFNIFLLNLILFTSIFILLDIGNMIKDFYTLYLGIFILFIFTFGFSLIVGALNRLNGIVANIVSISTRILFYLSGIFFTVDLIPSQYREYILYNPVIHFLELFRYAFFDTYNYQYYDLEYMFAWSLIVLTIGLSLNYFYKEKLKSIF